jgi:hypothetical protein
MLRDLSRIYRGSKAIDLVVDNLCTPSRKSLTDTYGPTIGGRLWERFCVHYTPKHGSWLNQAEIAISLVSRQCLGRQRIADPGLRRGRLCRACAKPLPPGRGAPIAAAPPSTGPLIADRRAEPAVTRKKISYGQRPSASSGLM